MKKDEDPFKVFKCQKAFFMSFILTLSLCSFSEAQSISNKLQKSINSDPSVIAAAGGLAKFDIIELEWTLGESFIGQATNNTTRTYTIGFHQPNISFKPDLFIAEENAEQIKFFPNPVINKLNLKFQLDNAENKGVFKFQLTDLLGKLILEKSINSENENSIVDIPEIATGSYQVKIISKNGKLLRTFKIIKNN